MSTSSHNRWIWTFLLVISGRATILAAELTSPLDLITSEAALCLEVPHLEESWSQFESGSMMNRLRQFPPFQRLLDSQGFRHWQAVEEHVVRQTGSRLSSQFRALFGRSLAIAIYVPSTGNPTGILIGEAINADAVSTAMETWNKLEPSGIVLNKIHHGHQYVQRKRDNNAKDSAFIAIADRWFAVSDNEELVQKVIDRYRLVTDPPQADVTANSLRQTPSFIRTRNRLKSDGVAYVHINARPWDRGLEEASQGSTDAVKLSDIWKHVGTVGATLRLQNGIICETIVDLDVTRLGSEWSNFAAAAGAPATWISRIPGDALLAVAGRLDIKPFIQFVVKQMPVHEQTELGMLRRIAQSLFGGNDILDSILPELARDFGGFLAMRHTENPDRILLDGAIGFHLGVPESSQLLSDLDHGLDVGLSLFAAYLSSTSPATVTVEPHQTEETRMRSLSANAAIPIAYGIKQNVLVVAGSEERLRSTIDSSSQPFQNPRIANDAERFFAGANQLVWFDTAAIRDLLEQHGSNLAKLFAHHSADEAKRIAARFEQVRPYLGLVDSVFIAGRIESDHIRIVFGGGLNSNGTSIRE